ncbi:MAG: amidase [Vicinamibacterales bacterium]
MSTLTRRDFAASLVAGAVASSLERTGRRAAAGRARRSWPALVDRGRRKLVRARKISATELVTAALDRIATYNPKLNAFITVTGRPHWPGPGCSTPCRPVRPAARCRVPIALKDNIDTAGIRTTAASSVYDDRVPADDAEVARRLTAAGAIVLGKLNLHEFANGGTSATSYYGPVRNPWALDHQSGRLVGRLGGGGVGGALLRRARHRHPAARSDAGVPIAASSG